MTQTFPFLELHEALLNWWQKNGRVLPWREKLPGTSREVVSPARGLRERAFQDYMTNELRRDPYRVVVAELMLQQTQVDRVIPKYLAWMTQWPRIENFAAAQLSEVLIFWQGLGYNRRARFLWLLAKEVAEKNEGVWPKAEDELRQLPGLGKYTARAVMSFAFGDQVAVVDTNVKRVLRRILEGKEASEAPIPTEKEWFALADSVLPEGHADPWNQLIMDLGAMVCVAKAPKCESCPVQNLCQAQHLALSKGFSTYREYLNSQPKISRKTGKKVRFEDTDRFFRGRMMDILRQGKLPQEDLKAKMASEHGLDDEKRFFKLLGGLIKEGLARQESEWVLLG